MNERHLSKLLRGLTLWTAPLSASVTLACGGATIGEPPPDGNQGGSEQGGGTSGSGQGGGSSGSSQGGSAGTFTFAGTGSGGTGVVVDNCRHDSPIGCQGATWVVPASCVPAGTASPNTALPNDTCNVICGPASFFCSVTEANAATVTVSCPPPCAVGRRPAGYCPSLTLESRALGKYFSQLAELEAASVTAFRVLRDELRAYGAPRRLVRAAGRAARDEIRHARTTRALARRSGARPSDVAPARPAIRSLEAIALENAVEGCVRETFGALLATYQSEHAADPVVRAAMQRIARDETGHAALSWQVARWLDSRLPAAARQRVTRARSEAARELVQRARQDDAPEFSDRVGLPPRALTGALATQLAAALW